MCCCCVMVESCNVLKLCDVPQLICYFLIYYIFLPNVKKKLSLLQCQGVSWPRYVGGTPHCVGGTLHCVGGTPHYVSGTAWDTILVIVMWENNYLDQKEEAIYLMELAVM